VKRRPRQANDVAEAERRERAPERAVVGCDAPAAFSVRENGQLFEVRLGDGLSTGLFLDQRENRARVAREAKGKRVLNLFAYTCAFGAVAARHGASRTVNIDVAKNVLERGRRNYQLAGIEEGEHQFLARDVLDMLPRLAHKGERYDLVVLDPPSYASTRKGRFSVERDYPELVTLAMRLVADGGLLLACTNHQKLQQRDLERGLAQASEAAQRPLQGLEFMGPAPDHPPAPGRAPHLKSAWIRL
jgi:23S rRNA (cytosine1962-C5)-methyltransferase